MSNGPTRLPPEQIDAIHRAAVECGFVAEPHQAALLAGLPAPYVAALPRDGGPSFSLLRTLHFLNQDGPLLDGTVPLERWLNNASLLAALRPQAEVFERARILLAGSPRAAAPAADLLDIPDSLGAGFIGRETLLVALHRAFHGAGQVALYGAGARSGHVSAYGGAGIGKSRLAIEYAHRYRAEYPGGVFYAIAGSRDPIALWAYFAREHPRLVGGDLTRDDAAAAAFANWLEEPEPGRRLVILDDVHAANARELYQRFEGAYSARGSSVWPVRSNGLVHVLFTTRQRELPRARPLEVAELAPEAALDLLLDRARRPIDRDTGHHLAARILGGHPLAIALAGAYLREVGPGYAVTEYVEKLQEEGLVAALEEAAEHAGYRVADYERSIVATLALSFSLLAPDNPRDAVAARIIRVTACLAPNAPVDRRLVSRLLEREGGRLKKDHVGLGIERLLDLGLLGPSREGGDDGDVKIHPLVADYVKWLIFRDHGETSWQALLGMVVDVMRQLFPSAKGELWKITVPHAAADWEWLSPVRETHVAAVWSAGMALGTRAVGRLGTTLGDLYTTRGDLERARSVHEAVLSLRERLCAEHPNDLEKQRDLLETHNRLGNLLHIQGDLEETLNEHQRAEEMAEVLALLDPNNTRRHHDLLITYERVGNELRALGKWNEALVKYERAKEIAEYLIRQDPDNALLQRSLSTANERLGDMMRYWGMPMVALEHYRRVEALRERLHLSDPHNAEAQRDLSIIQNRIGDVLKDTGQFEAALHQHRGAVVIREHLLALDPGNAEWRTDLARSYMRVVRDLRELASTPRGELRALLDRIRSTLAPLVAAGRLTTGQAKLRDDVERYEAELALDEEPTPIVGGDDAGST